MTVSRVNITYKSPEIDEELDKKILEFFNTLDFVCIDRSYMPMIWRRQIDFEKHTKNVWKKFETQYHLKPMYVGEGIDESSSN